MFPFVSSVLHNNLIHVLSDIVDSEPFDGGNVLKMFLGPVFNWYDDDDDDELGSG